MPDSVSYVDLLMAEWGLQRYSHRLQTCMRRVLRELTPESQLVLRREPKLQVEVVPESTESVWAYFPVHRRRFIVTRLKLKLKPTARVLLVISEKHTDSDIQFTDYLRDHLGHVLLYLRSPRSRNERQDAGREWLMSCDSQPKKASA